MPASLYQLNQQNTDDIEFYKDVLGAIRTPPLIIIDSIIYIAELQNKKRK
jgi:hypothetical protein